MVHLINRNTRNSVLIKIYFQYLSEWPAYFNQNETSYMATLDAKSQLKW